MAFIDSDPMYTQAWVPDALNHAADPQAHADAAREVAKEYFDSEKVLTELVERAMNVSRTINQ